MWKWKKGKRHILFYFYIKIGEETREDKEWIFTKLTFSRYLSHNHIPNNIKKNEQNENIRSKSIATLDKYVIRKTFLIPKIFISNKKGDKIPLSKTIPRQSLKIVQFVNTRVFFPINVRKTKILFPLDWAVWRIFFF